MSLFVFGLIGILVAIQAVYLVSKFLMRRNESKSYKEAFFDFQEEMQKKDKEFAPYGKKIVDNLNVVDHWLRTGLDRVAMENAEEKYKQTGQMDAVQVPADKARRRHDVFEVRNLKPEPVGQTEASFQYMDEYSECIVYCVTPEALEHKKYRYALYFTTARPTQMPLVYPHKYEGAALYSLYQHPSQAIWFLQNWKKVRDNLEIAQFSVNEEISEKLSGFEV